MTGDRNEGRPHPDCPLYGHAMFVGSRGAMLMPQGGNQCAIVLGSHSPCRMEIEGQPIDWRRCQRLKEYGAHYETGTGPEAGDHAGGG